jgi:hypothetical protein
MIITKAMLELVIECKKKVFKDSKPPAEAPIATIIGESLSTGGKSASFEKLFCNFNGLEFFFHYYYSLLMFYLIQDRRTGFGC